MISMNPGRIAELLAPFATVTPAQLDHISIYIDLLQRWNARVNLTAIRDPEEIVTRHFGESLFAASHLLPRSALADSAAKSPAAAEGRVHRIVDLGSGAGFPGLPLKIWSPQSSVTLIESNQKKVAFLREVTRALTLTSIDVFSDRAEAYPPATAALVTLRAVEHFETILSTAASLVRPGGRLALLIATPQIPAATVQPLTWSAPIPIPRSASRVLLTGLLSPSGESDQ
jgi:16S rRNA (guanine527-N7)-methyltransferase